MAEETFTRKINIYVDSGQAQAAYDKLTAASVKLSAKESELQAKLQKHSKEYADLVDAKTKKDKARRAELEKLISKELSELDKLKKSHTELNAQLERQAKKISGELSPSHKDLISLLQKESQLLSTMSKQDDGYKAQFERVAALRKETAAYTGVLNRVQTGLQNMLQTAKGVAVGVVIGNTVQAVTQKVTGYFNGILTGAGKLSDSLTNIQKTTNLPDSELRELNKNLRDIDTRTPTEGLRELAAEAGKLGKESREDVKAFVDEANQIKVALGEDLGEGAITQIGKAAKIYNQTMLELGSGVNEISDASEATGDFAVDFMFRMGGISRTAKISAGDILGYGAALELAGQQTEASSTALNKFFIDFIKDSDKFGKAAGFAKGELAKLINEKGTNVAFIGFLKGIKESTKSTDEFLKKLEDLGIDGARGSSTFLALANSIDVVEKNQKIANEAINEGSSITEEYNKRNNNFAAQLARISKEWAGLTNSTTVLDFLTSGANLTLAFMRALRQFPEALNENSNLLIALATAYVIYNRAVIASTLSNVAANVAFRAQYAWLIITETATKAMTIATAAYSLATGVLTRQITLATAAQRVFTAASSVNPWVALVTVLATAAGALAIWANSARDAFKSQKLLADITLTAATNIAEEKSRVESLLSVARDEKISKEQRLAAIQELNRISPEYLGNITLENINTVETTKAVERYIDALNRKALAQAFDQKRTELSRKLIDAEAAQKESLRKIEANVEAGDQQHIKTLKERTGIKVDEIKKEIAALDELYKAKVKSGDISVSTPDKPFSLVQPSGTFDTVQISGGLSDEEKKAAKKKHDEMIQLRINLKKAMEKLGKDNLEFEDKLRAESLATLDEHYAAQKQKLAQAKTEQGASEEQYRAEQLLLEINQKKARLTLAEEFASGSAESDKQIVQFKKDLSDAELAYYEYIQVLKTKVLSEQSAEQLKLIEQQKQFEKQQFEQITQDVAGYVAKAMQVWGSFNQMQTNSENKKLADQQKHHDKEVKGLEDMLSKKRITRKQHDARIAALDADLDKKKHELAVKQFKREQAMGIAKALIAGGEASMKAWADYGWPWALIPQAFIIAVTAAEVAMIASQEPPSYGAGDENWRAGIAGDKHSEPSKGNPIIDPKTGMVIGLTEEGEAFIPADSTAANQPVIKWMLRNRGKTLNFNRATENIQYAAGTLRYQNADGLPRISTNLTEEGEGDGGIMNMLISEVRTLTQQVSAMKDKRVILVKDDQQRFEQNQSVIFKRQI